MKKIGIAFVLTFVALGLAAAAAPKITEDNSFFDFETVLEGAVVSHTFILSNAGDEPLIIENVKAGCGCTATALSKSTLAAGETVELTAEVDTTGFSRVIAKSISVYSNDPETPRLILIMKGLVQQAHHITAGDLDHLYYILIDLRDEEEYGAGHLTGAISIPHAELEEWTGRFPTDVPIILYDEDGSLSDQAVQTLEEAGFDGARSLLGGLDEWTRQLKRRFIVASSER